MNRVCDQSQLFNSPFFEIVIFVQDYEDNQAQKDAYDVYAQIPQLLT